MSGHNEVAENATRRLFDARSKRIEELNRNWADYANQTTFATNEAEEGLLDAYFAEKVIRQFGIPDGTHTYSFGGTNDTSTAARKRNIAQIIFDRVSPQLVGNNQHTAIELIIAALVADSYSKANGDTVTFGIFKTEEKVSYQKVNSGMLGGDAYIAVKGFALKDKEATIEIFEKSPYLLMESETPLTVIQYDSLDAEKPVEEVNKTELKAVFNDSGEAIVKIKLRPKVEDPDTIYNEWREKFVPKEPEQGVSLPPPSPEEMQNIAPEQPLTFGNGTLGENTLSTPNESTNFPLPGAQQALPPIVDFLWLKVTASGDKQDYEEVFLRMGNGYFRIENKCCTQEMTKEQMMNIAVHARESNVDTHLSGINEAFNDNEINTCLRRLHFLAQVIHESGSFRYTEELGVGESAYGGFKGRGLMQLTFRSNYEAYGSFIGEDFTSSQQNKEKLENNPHAAKSAGWFWAQNAALNDNADDNDLIYITYRINGGFNGYNDRLEYVRKGFEILYKTCNNSNEESTDYVFSESKTYNEQKGSFGWGAWHDPGTNKRGCTKNKRKAIEGYERFIALNNAAGGSTPSRNWYGYNKARIRSFVESRLVILKS